MAQYARELPVDKNNNPYTVSSPNFPAFITQSGTPTNSSVLTLTDKTTVIEVSAVGGPILMKWGSASITSAIFDNIISANTTRTFVVPQSVMAASSNQSVMGANGANGLYTTVAFKTLGASSIATVFTAEF